MSKGEGKHRNKGKKQSAEDRISAERNSKSDSMGVTSKGCCSGWFPWKTLIFFIVIGTGIAVNRDVKDSGSWEASKTNQALESYRVYEYASLVRNKTGDAWEWSLSRVEQQYPGFRAAANDRLAPYCILATDVGIVVRNRVCDLRDYVVASYPVVVNKIEEYAPGLIDNTKNVAANVWDATVTYSNRTIVYLKTELFVGSLAPENIVDTSIKQVHVAREKVVEGFGWLRKKVEAMLR